jgi:predicted dehydrogenase
VHPIEAEDHGIGLIKFANGAVGQFEVSWAFRGGMDLRDEVSGTQGTLWLNHFLRTGFEMFTSGESGGYVAEKSERESGWLFPVGDEVNELGYVHMFADMLEAWDNGTAPMETFYDGYVVNAILDACYKSARTKQWEPVQLETWRGATQVEKIKAPAQEFEGRILIKRERMPDGVTKYILKDKQTGQITNVHR